MTNIESNEFNTLYCKLNEADKVLFKTIVIKLLKVNFLLKINNEENYIYILKHKNLFKLFFKYMNFLFYLREDKELAYIKTEDEVQINHINKNETLCLLTLRLLYNSKSNEISLLDNIVVSVEELQTKLFSIGFNEKNQDRVKKTLLKEMLRTFKQHNIIYYNEDIALDTTRITIYPSIEVAMDFNTLEDVLMRLDALKGGESV